VPLLVLTADRPPEMRACASGQAIDQQKLFGGLHVRFQHELAVPELGEACLRYVRQMAATAAGQALHTFSGAGASQRAVSGSAAAGRG
jgi:2-succinyl-5-enolpyruvyl-6-hydroxy-3-cyclohexene-1-carboxylate synthase